MADEWRSIPAQVYAAHGLTTNGLWEIITIARGEQMEVLLTINGDRLHLKLDRPVFNKFSEFLWAVSQDTRDEVEGNPAMMQADDYRIGVIK